MTGWAEINNGEIIMSMSDCEKCWDTPCTCGWEYRNYTKDRRLKLAASVLGVNAAELGARLVDFIPDVHPQNKVPNAEWTPK